jgi:hypothetical protein
MRTAAACDATVTALVTSGTISDPAWIETTRGC